MTRNNQHGEPQPGIPVGPLAMRVLEVAYRGRLAVIVEGETGIGKSQIFEQLTKNLGIDLVVIDLSLLEPPDLVGLPIIQNGRTTYAVPEILPAAGSGIILLEELNRAPLYIRQSALQLLTARRLHGYCVPSGYMVCAAINPEDSHYEVSRLCPALRSRFLNLKVRADRSSWLLWAECHGIHPIVLHLAMTHEEFLNDVPPRTWEFVSQLLLTLEPDEAGDEELVRAMLTGYLPSSLVELTIQATNDVAPHNPFAVRKLLARFHKDRSLRKKICDLRKNGQTDLLNQLTLQVRSILSGPQMKSMIEAERFSLASFEQLLRELPGDSAEQLQEAFADNHHASALIDVTPEDILGGYSRPAVSRKLKRWASDRSKHFLIATLLNSMYRHQDTDVNGLQARPDELANLGQFVSDVARCSERLQQMCERLKWQPAKKPAKKRKQR